MINLRRRNFIFQIYRNPNWLGSFATSYLDGNVNGPKSGQLRPAKPASRASNQTRNIARSTCLLQQRKPDKADPHISQIDQTANILFKSNSHRHGQRQKRCNFGFMFDIDGVLVRGRRVIPSAIKAIRNVLKARVPVLFLSNGGCETEDHKARVLTTQLHHKIHADQIVLSHSPLRKLEALHDKHVVVSGQGPVAEIAVSCGFKNVSTVEEISDACPLLDVNDRKRRFHVEIFIRYYYLKSSADTSSEKYLASRAMLLRRGLKPPHRCHNMQQTEGILVMGEPIHWEKHLQVLIDLLITDGMPNDALNEIPDKNMPIIAVNPDLLWMSEATNPRFGNGAFLCCLESLYKKLTGNELEYISILGKPNLFTYKYAAEALLAHACKVHGGDTAIERVYIVGDNIDTDIYGANIYHDFLSKFERSRAICKEDELCRAQWQPNSIRSVESILVGTGVSAVEKSLPQRGINHLHRDTAYRPEMTMPTYIVHDVLEAVNLILRKEEVHIDS